MHARPPVHLLFVCTANQCRSPMAAAFARYEMTRRAVPGIVSSAGFLEGGATAAPGAIRAMKEYGLDLSDHVSSQIDRSLVNLADVVITMEGSHILDLASIDPNAAQRAVPMGVAVQDLTDPASRPMGPTALRAWVTSRRRDLDVVLDERHDVPDPMGHSVRRFRRARDLIADAVGHLCDGWFGPPPD